LLGLFLLAGKIAAMTPRSIPVILGMYLEHDMIVAPVLPALTSASP
jgi:hypothetical protein